ncbi:hypothetical protein BKA67DRAFT_223409 [Truncatella angustata]|uniref:Uncharacterized protein n=1 Tax=Truncatella angustata TaxID=152316 RepID=A0A9P8ZXL2_9PEZI|nr:uncharacterized protein BKA67DRAFT_223409 [Truncatella angustata]KAH6655011.1 hypothetical protein BKA67DRAFT_223409 [Truncatella angustata]
MTDYFPSLGKHINMCGIPASTCLPEPKLHSRRCKRASTRPAGQLTPTPDLLGRTPSSATLYRSSRRATRKHQIGQPRAGLWATVPRGRRSPAVYRRLCPGCSLHWDGGHGTELKTSNVPDRATHSLSVSV